MKAEQANFVRFLDSPKQLIIPIYQRTYSWKIAECEQLWKDILKTGKDDEIAGHSIGSVVIQIDLRIYSDNQECRVS